MIKKNEKILQKISAEVMELAEKMNNPIECHRLVFLAEQLYSMIAKPQKKGVNPNYETD